MGAHEHRTGTETHPINQPLSHCPVCGSSRLEPVVEIERQTVHFLCGDCSRCWQVELGYVRRMTPDTCRGCPERARCERAVAADRQENRI
jgi:transposase-like protein